MSDNTKTQSYQQWEVDKLVDEKVEAALLKYDIQMQKALVNMFIINLSKFETAYQIGKFVVVAVALLLIGTVYQLFISLANSQGLSK